MFYPSVCVLDSVETTLMSYIFYVVTFGCRYICYIALLHKNFTFYLNMYFALVSDIYSCTLLY